jgi:hypothetical protein
MREEKRLLKSIALGSLPALVMILVLAYIFAGQVFLLDVLEFWGLGILEVASFLLLLQQTIPGNNRKKVSIFLLVMAVATVYLLTTPVNLQRIRLTLIINLCVLTILNIALCYVRRKSTSN